MRKLMKVKIKLWITYAFWK